MGWSTNVFDRRYHLPEFFIYFIFFFFFFFLSSENHERLFRENGFQDIRTYRYWDAKNKCFDFEGMCEDLERAPENAVIVLHECAHNPTGCDPTKEQWMKISDIMKVRSYCVYERGRGGLTYVRAILSVALQQFHDDSSSKMILWLLFLVYLARINSRYTVLLSHRSLPLQTIFYPP